MADLAAFSIDDLVELSASLRVLGQHSSSMEETAQSVVDHFYDCLSDAGGRPACALVRFYKTHRFDRLPADLQVFAREATSEEVRGDTRCLTLLGTTGHLPAWRDRSSSRSHQAIPLTSETAVEALPMVSRLIAELGIEVAHVVAPPEGDIVLDLHHQSYNVFHVAAAKGSPWIPAQDFVADHGIESALGLGGMLPTGDIFAVVLFATVRVDERVADLFRSLAPAVKAAVVRHSYDVFSGAALA